MVRRVLALTAVSAAAVALFYTATSAPGPPSPNAPVSTERPFLQPAGGNEIQVDPQVGSWVQRVRGPLHLSYSWLECDLGGKRCSPLPGLNAKSIAPPQELRIVTLRGVVTATNRFGSTTATTRNLYYDEAGFPVKHRKGLRPPFYDPVQLRTWYGFRPEQDGAGQTILITAFWSTPGLRAAVDRFSSRYGLPLACGTAHAGRGCFRLADVTHGQPTVVTAAENEDIEWAHAIAPRARIVVLRAPTIPDLLHAVGHVARVEDAHVVSASWGSNLLGAGLERNLYGPVAADCHLAHLVCTFPSGDSGHPGDGPSNSPYVLAVGGSVFRPRADGSLAAERHWPYGGFGPTVETQPRPAWQKGLPGCRAVNATTTSGVQLHLRDPTCDNRVVPDVTATADGVLDYEIPPNRHRNPGWFFGGGTSLSSPLWAALLAVADQELDRDGQPPIGIDELHGVLYRGWVSSGLDDIDKRGWDERTGWGSPKAGVVDTLTKAIERYRATR